MTFEQKLKAAALEAALHPALRHAAKNPARTARNLVNLPQASPAACLTMHKKPNCMMQSIPCCRKRDREHLFALLEHAAGLCE